MIRILPIVVDAGVGAIDGALQHADDKATPARVGYRQFSAMFELGAVGLGLVGGLMRFSPDITDPVLMGGLALAARRGTMELMKPKAAAMLSLPMHQYSAVRAAASYNPMDRFAPTGLLG